MYRSKLPADALTRSATARKRIGRSTPARSIGRGTIVLSRRMTCVLLALLAMTALASGSPASAGAQSVASRPPDPPGSRSAFRAAATVGPGSYGAVVITVGLKAASDTPETVADQTPAQVVHDVIDASRPWFQDVSHGMFVGYFALKRGPVTVQTTKPVCSPEWRNEIADQADAAVREHEPNLVPSRYNAFIYYFGKVEACARPNPYNPAGASGWGGQGKRVWLNGDHSLRVAVHELGHNLGLDHSGSQSCMDALGREVPLSSSCTQAEYGDAYSAMGSQLSDGYSPSQMAQLGWNDGRVRTVTANDATAHYFLTTAEANAPGTTQALRLLDGSTTLWLEYRGLSPLNASGLNGGLLVRREQPSLAGSPFLLAMNSPDQSGPFQTPHPNMDVGQTWANPLGTMAITVDSADGAGAGVTIKTAAVQLKTVPNLVGRSTTAASNAVTAAGLTVGNVGTRVDSFCKRLDEVLTQTPQPGTQLPAGSPVDYVYAVPPRRCLISPP